MRQLHDVGVRKWNIYNCQDNCKCVYKLSHFGVLPHASFCGDKMSAYTSASLPMILD